MDATHQLQATYLAMCVAAIIALAVNQDASADMYKCIGSNGKVEYRDKACEGSAGAKFTPSENTVGTGEGIESVRAKDAALRTRQDIRRATADKEVADARAAQESAFQQERAHQDSVDRTNAIREASSRRAADDYKARAYQDSVDRAIANREASARRAADNNNSQHYRQSASVPVQIKPTPVKPKPPQLLNAYQVAQPAGLPVRHGDY